MTMHPNLKYVFTLIASLAVSLHLFSRSWSSRPSDSLRLSEQSDEAGLGQVRHRQVTQHPEKLLCIDNVRGGHLKEKGLTRFFLF